MTPNGWTPARAPRMDGKVVVVTGANSGVGLETARHLARLGGQVVMACRHSGAAAAARIDILRTVPTASVEIVQLDLADLASVHKAADEITTTHRSVDVLINNAGVMAGSRQLTVDGFEMDFGTSFLGHFALTGLLLAPLFAAEAARVVTVGSNAHRAGRIDFDDLTMARSFSPARAYGRAKFAQLVFAVELQRRLTAAGRTWPISVAAHPGATHSGVMRNQSRLLQWLFTTPSLHWARRTFVMEGVDGALPSVRAATDPGVLGGQYYGPAGPLHLSGPPILVAAKDDVYDAELGRRLWDTATELTGVYWSLSG
ncbi:oxidoreductase [Gordonia rhizosphera]|nr:oxidoreductase [Gordonia rhizosphera]